MIVSIRPQEYPLALRNPLMGFRADINSGHEWATLAKTYIPWNAIENDESDDVDKIRAYCDKLWRIGGVRGVEEMNIKVIPRVYLDYPQRKEKAWPADMQPDDYSSEQFVRRVARLSERLAEVWDNDPRVAYVEMGLIGKWGEHHSPSVTPAMQKLLGDIFSQRFKNKLVMVRHPWDFQDYSFGIYWDSWAHIQQMSTHGEGIAKLGDRWKVAPMGGETAYDWGDFRIQPGDDPNDTLRDPQHRRFLIDSIRWLHCNHLGWVANYNPSDPEVRLGAEEVQKAFGYRFVIEEVRYPAQVSQGQEFEVTFSVRNNGSSPFYYNWPIEVSLLDARTRSVVWKDMFKGLDIRTWLPGDDWDKQQQAYRIPPQLYTAKGTFVLPKELPTGEYILALAILDPAGMLPSARFAIINYYKGGRHPIGRIGVGRTITNATLDANSFDDPIQDLSLHYSLGRESKTVTFKEVDTVFQNPGKGWMSWGASDRFPSSVAYVRWNWMDLEPSEGQYDWARIDSAIAKATQQGKRLAFRVMTANAHTNGYYCSPKWLFDAGCAYNEYVRGGEDTMEGGARITRIEPVYSDPIYLAKHGAFLAALGARYDGHAGIEFLDIGSYGIWGEWHTPNPVSTEVRRQIVDMYLRAFRKTPLVFMSDDAEMLAYALAHGTGYRRDGVGSPWHEENWIGSAKYANVSGFAEAWKQAPVVFEWYGPYDFLMRRGWSFDRAVDFMLNNHVTYINDNVGQVPYEQLVRLMELARRAGYRFVLRELSHADPVQRGQSLDLVMRWSNVGVGRIYRKYPLVLYLLDAEGRSVASTVGDADVRTWLPGDHRVVERISIPQNIAPGEYALGLALADADTLQPAIKLAIDAPERDRMYIVSQLTVK